LLTKIPASVLTLFLSLAMGGVYFVYLADDGPLNFRVGQGVAWGLIFGAALWYGLLANMKSRSEKQQHNRRLIAILLTLPWLLGHFGWAYVQSSKSFIAGCEKNAEPALCTCLNSKMALPVFTFELQQKQALALNMPQPAHKPNFAVALAACAPNMLQ